jgi:hypothetical protein
MADCDSTEEGEVAVVTLEDGVSLEVCFAAKESFVSFITEAGSIWIVGESIVEVEEALAEYAAE